MNYFGTNLDSAGHYFWELENWKMKRSEIWFNDIPFNPEELPKYEKGEEQNKGDVKYYHSNGYNICAINGSCIDKRHGCHSVFFATDELTNNQLKDKILSIPIAKKIIEQMPFEVRW
jgi:hypothetical protein